MTSLIPLEEKSTTHEDVRSQLNGPGVVKEFSFFVPEHKVNTG